MKIHWVFFFLQTHTGMFEHVSQLFFISCVKITLKCTEKVIRCSNSCHDIITCKQLQWNLKHGFRFVFLIITKINQY